MPKHKHADLIHAYAEGAEVQYKNREGYWEDIENPSWIPLLEYRIKKRIMNNEGFVIVSREPGVSTHVDSWIFSSKESAQAEANKHKDSVAIAKITWVEEE